MTEPVSTPVENAAPAAAESVRTERRPSHRGGRGRAEQSGKPAARPAREVHPVLAQLAQLHPVLFGETVLPLKRGIFQDLLAAHGDALDKAGLKVALSIHTRSTRYLNAVASGAARHDLQGNVVEAMAPEHVFHALVEVFKRKKPRDGEDLQAKLRRRMAIAFMASGMRREAYLEVVQVRDEATQALLDAALTEVAEQDAKAEAVERAYVASGSGDVRAFADMYGMNAHTVMRQLHRAKQLQANQTA
ncbi:MAG TPA: ProQ/FINO family protein [Comamonas sp.]|uniref:ProQ/FINO family protein n=1 Tax=Comamonas halotolerans TaxID=3041496 RepID=UPI0024E0FDE6|nr:ProQ/FINO family protein [Comamonas sp. NoAH]